MGVLFSARGKKVGSCFQRGARKKHVVVLGSVFRTERRNKCEGPVLRAEREKNVEVPFFDFFEGFGQVMKITVQDLTPSLFTHDAC